MVYFKFEFGFHLPGRKHRAENKTNSKAQPAWDFISKEVESPRHESATRPQPTIAPQPTR